MDLKPQPQLQGTRMFNFDQINEIFNALLKNKLRTFLTGFAVGWGIFMLIVLLGASEGLQNGISDEFKDDAINSIWISAGRTSEAYQGLQPGRRIQMTNRDFDRVAEFEGVEYITARYSLWSGLVNRGSRGGTYSIRGTHPEHKYLEKTNVIQGRFLHDLDLKEKRKVIVIGNKVRLDLFEPSEDPLGQYISVFGIPYRVVGVFKDDGAESEERMVYIPITTAQIVFNGADRINRLMFTIGDMSLEESMVIADEVRADMSKVHKFAFDDQRAMRVRNNNEEFARFSAVMNGIKGFMQFIGFMTIISGMIGVGNIMTVVVKERTREIGIRKALGATPFSVVLMILLESVIVTSFSGYIGLLFGAGLIEVLRPMFTEAPFIAPAVDFQLVIMAMGMLVLAGVVAGLIPSLRAARIRPIEALRDE